LLVCDTPDAPLLQHGNYTQMFQNLFQEPLESFDVTKNEYPQKEYDSYIITGSRYSAYEDVEWIHKLKQFVRDLDKKGAKIVGICFGHQIVAEALGGKVSKNPGGWEIGWTRLKLNDDGKRVFGREWLDIQEMHQDHVSVVPPGFTVLGATAICPVQVMQKSNIVTLQGHPEFKHEFVKQLISIRTNKGIFTEDQQDRA
ncbi:class I glutamine amidotransferase-like protein, partial [Gorgonomyces haynaldii]